MQAIRETKETPMQKETKERSNTPLRIWLKYLLTPFNAFNFAIGLALAAVGAYENLLYLGVILLNIAVGIIQELRAKSIVDSLALLSVTKAQVLKDGTVSQVNVEEVKQGDTVLFMPGDQIYAECSVLEGQAEVNEALLTGESEPVMKLPGDPLLSGSYIISGHCKAIAEETGEDCYAEKLTRKAKSYKAYQSGIMDALNRLVRFTGYFILPLGAILFYHSYIGSGDAFETAVVTTSAALLGLLPKGLVLLTSVSLAIGVIKLGRKKLLVQELYGIEALARADVICMDKTGTLTTGDLAVTEVIPLCDSSEEQVQFLGSLLSGAFQTQNSTYAALQKHFPQYGVSPSHVVEFSPSRGWSAVYYAGIGTIMLGQWERLFQEAPPDAVVNAMESGKRIVVIGRSDHTLSEDLPADRKPVAALCIQDTLRENTAEVLEYFRVQGVALKILSGDHPHTVSAIARAAGLTAKGCVDVTGMDEAALSGIVETTDVFGRVTPDQKMILIRLLQSHGHRVAMLGDGVNDVMALKEADCGIAMSSGCDAARKVARMILFGDSFNVLPKVLSEGRRVVNNISVTASLFLTKTCFSFLLSLVFVLLGRAYPLIPLQLSIYGLLFEAIPAFILTFRENDMPIQDQILQRAIKRAFPFALGITFFTTVIHVAGVTRGYLTGDLSWISFGVAAIFGALLVGEVCSQKADKRLPTIAYSDKN